MVKKSAKIIVKGARSESFADVLRCTNVALASSSDTQAIAAYTSSIVQPAVQPHVDAAAASAASAKVEADRAAQTIPLLSRAGAHRLTAVGSAAMFAVNGEEVLFDSNYYRSGSSVLAGYSALPGWAFARAAVAYVNVNGVLQSVASGQPRIGAKGILVERAATNRALFSGDFTNPNWYAANTTVTANAANAPDGTASAEKLTETTASGLHRILQTGAATANTDYTFSIFAKQAERSKVALADTGGSGAVAAFDLASGVVLSGPGVIERLANGWFRCALRFRTGASQTGWNCQVRALNDAGNEDYAGDAAKGLYLWGGQVETGKGPSSYIPTTNAMASRAADVVSYSAALPGAGAILIEATPGPGVFSNATLAEWYAAGTRVVLAMNGDLQVFLYINSGGVEEYIYMASMTPGVASKIALRWEASGIASYMNGNSYGQTARTMPPPTTLAVGADNAGGASFNGSIGKIVTFTPPPDEAEMRRMTQGGLAIASASALGKVITVASSTSKNSHSADLVCNGLNDSAMINLALDALTEGGVVQLLDGNFLLDRTMMFPADFDPLPNADTGLTPRGALFITRSHTTLKGLGRDATTMTLKDNQKCNVIRVAGDGLEHINIESLRINPNGPNNFTDPNLVEWKEICGINTRRTKGNLTRHVNITGLIIDKSNGLGVYLHGYDVHLSNSIIMAAIHDIAELCDGCVGSITGVTAIVDNGDACYYGLGTDAFDDFIIANNTIIVKSGGYLSGAAHRLWPGVYRGTLANNVLRVEGDGRLNGAVHAWSSLATVVGNVLRGHANIAEWGRTEIELASGVNFSGNVGECIKFLVTGSPSGADLNTIPTAKKMVRDNTLVDCEAAPAHAELEWTGNNEFTLP